MDVPGYKLAKEGCYYYLFKDKALAHAQAVSSKLKELNDIPINALTSPPIVKDPVVKSGEIHPDLQRALAAEMATQAEHVEGMALMELHQENSVEILPVDADRYPEEPSECFKPEEIKISVIRPSPVKEVPSTPINDDATSGSSIQVLALLTECNFE